MTEHTRRASLTQTQFVMMPLWVMDHPDITPTNHVLYGHLRAMIFVGAEWRSPKSEVVQALMERSGYGRTACYDALSWFEGIGALVWRGRSAFMPVDDPSPAADDGDRESATPDAPSAATDAESVAADRTSIEEKALEGRPNASRQRRPSAADVAASTKRFEEHFWPVYPRRNGRRVGKRAALQAWQRLSIDDQREVVHAARAYASACAGGETIPRDPERFFRSRYWEEWARTPKVEEASVTPLADAPSSREQRRIAAHVTTSQRFLARHAQ